MEGPDNTRLQCSAEVIVPPSRASRGRRQWARQKKMETKMGSVDPYKWLNL